MIDAGLYALLSASNSGDALDMYVNGRVYAGDMPDDLSQFPCVTYMFVGGSANPTLTTSGVIKQRIEINCFAVNPANDLTPGSIAAAMRMAVIARVNGWQQTDVGGDGTRVLIANLLNPGTDFVTEQRIFRAMCEFYVLYTLP